MVTFYRMFAAAGTAALLVLTPAAKAQDMPMKPARFGGRLGTPGAPPVHPSPEDAGSTP